MKKSLCVIVLMVVTVVSLSYLLGACRKDQSTDGLQALQLEVPTAFPQPNNIFANNPLSEEGFQLGRKLFYDGRLSIDGVHPCVSCHERDAAFGTFQHDRAHGVFGSHTLRNAPGIFNLAWNPSFHWDAEFTSLESEAAQPINGHIEMGESWEGVINKIKDDKEYRDLFRKVFRSSFIRPEFIVKALSQFTGSLVSADSKYDRYKKGTATFTTAEEQGYQVYKASCASCHPEPLFTDYKLRNIGLPVDNFLNDYGRMRITGDKNDSLKFKTPTLRNTYISANYMHDGRFNTLFQCITHYRTNVQASATLDPLLVGGITMTDQQANNLNVFLRTLTDSAFILNPRFQKPD